MHLGVYVMKERPHEESIDLTVIPSEDLVLSNVLQRAIDGHLPEFPYDFPENCIKDWKYEGQPQHGCGVFSSTLFAILYLLKQLQFCVLFKNLDVDWRVVKMTDKGTLRCPTELNSEGNWISKQPRKAINKKYKICKRTLSERIHRLMALYKDFGKIKYKFKRK